MWRWFRKAAVQRKQAARRGIHVQKVLVAWEERDLEMVRSALHDALQECDGYELIAVLAQYIDMRELADAIDQRPPGDNRRPRYVRSPRPYDRDRWEQEFKRDWESYEAELGRERRSVERDLNRVTDETAAETDQRIADYVRRAELDARRLKDARDQYWTPD
ncbi:hypothetical protein GCM10010411_76270 [Actinomadura fulvescens]|uniref:Uncharacterized protein n=1 Tax=Actinomadura fulvescens TaxID=46160 RepID=A0ABN3QJ15_9ACTN